MRPSTIGILYGVIMIPLGVLAYFTAETQSITALFGSFAGGLVLIMSILAARGSEKMRMHAMHVVALLLLLTAGGSGSRLPGALEGGIGHTGGFLLANMLISLVGLGFMIKSFIDARRARTAAAAEAPAGE